MKRVIFGACAVVAFAGVASAAQDFTHVRTGSEPSHLALFNTVYGGGFVSVGNVNGTDQGNGNTVATDGGFTTLGANSSGFAWQFLRVQDRNGLSPLQMDGSNSLFGAQDTHWADGVINVRVTAKVAGDSHVFGWYNDASASGFQAITPTVVGSTVDNVSLSTEFRWGLNTSQNLSLTSNEADNQGGKDMMVTYTIFRDGLFYGWLLAWEDRLNGDFDYNDAWIEIALVRPIPTPLGAGMGLAGLAGLALRRRR